MLYAISCFAVNSSMSDSEGLPDIVHMSGYAYGADQDEVRRLALEQWQTKLPPEDGWYRHDISLTLIPGLMMSAEPGSEAEYDTDGKMMVLGMFRDQSLEQILDDMEGLQMMNIPIYRCIHKGNPAACINVSRHTQPYYRRRYVDQNRTCPECLCPGTLV